MKLRPYQIKARDEIEEELRRVRATLLELATGLGKSIVIADVLRRRARRHSRALVLAHRDELIEQLRGKLIGARMAPALEKGAQRASLDRKIVLSSPQTLRGRRLSRFPADHFDTIVADECHRALAPSYRAIFAHFPAAKILGATATPERADRKPLADVFDSIAYSYGLRAAIEDDWLTPIRVARIPLSAVDTRMVPTRAGELAPAELAKVMEGKITTREIADGVTSQAVIHGDDPSRTARTIVFCASVASARAVAALIDRAQPGTARAIDGKTLKRERAQAIADHRAGVFPYLVNCDVLTEGYDDPDVTCVAIARPTASRVVLSQMIGRGTRKSALATHVRVLLFQGTATDGRLAHVGDVLAGRRLSEDARAALDGVMASGGEIDLESALERAEILDSEYTAARERAAVRWMGEIESLIGSPFLWSGQLDGGARHDLDVSEARREQLGAAGFALGELPDTLSDSEARSVLAHLASRAANGLCSYRDARLLARAGVDARKVTAARAAQLIAIMAAQDFVPWALRGEPEARAYTSGWDAITERGSSPSGRSGEALPNGSAVGSSPSGRSDEALPKGSAVGSFAAQTSAAQDRT